NVPSSRLQIATLVEMLLGSPDSAQLIASTVMLDPSSAYYQTLGLISIQANALSEGDIDYIVTAVRDVVAGQEGSGIDYRVAGGFAIVSDIFGGLTSTQARTTVLALLLCFAVVALLQRSAFYGALALLPVALTILWEFLVLWALGWAFDLFTVMISALIVGIGIDFAVHIVHRFREEAERGVSTEEALTSVIMNVGKALLSTTVTTAGAFAIIGLSIMPMMARFGILTATTITFSFVIALFVLPPILAWRHESSAKA
ncbi:MAG: MMPL family transporter, partial [Candidatus Methanofastidiosa archaeon]|nr:MMPL family transporter [Candidatus Methanofastidiosa archaeon]